MRGFFQIQRLSGIFKAPGRFQSYAANNATDLMQVVNSTGLMQVANKLYQAC